MTTSKDSSSRITTAAAGGSHSQDDCLEKLNRLCITLDAISFRLAKVLVGEGDRHLESRAETRRRPLDEVQKTKPYYPQEQSKNKMDYFVLKTKPPSSWRSIPQTIANEVELKRCHHSYTSPPERSNTDVPILSLEEGDLCHKGKIVESWAYVRALKSGLVGWFPAAFLGDPLGSSSC